MLWQEIKEILAEKLPESVFSLWIAPLSGTTNDKNILELTGPDNFFCSWVAEKYLADIKGALDCAGRQDVGITFKVRGEGSTAAALLPSRPEPPRLPDMPRARTFIRTLHPRFTFDEFVVGDSNFFAHSACEAIATNDTRIGSCVYLKAGTGLGKSHLTHAVAHHILNHSPSTRLNYLTAQQLTAEMVKNIKNNSMNRFKRQFQDQCDVLLVEDIHTLAGRKKTQEELAETLDILLETGKRVIFTSPFAPREIDDIDGAFRSRLSSGLISTINPPDLTTRYNIIRRKAITNNLKLSDEMITYLSENIRGDVRQIESTIVSLKAQASLLKTDPDFIMVKETLRNVIGQQKQLSPLIIRDFVAGQFQVDINDLKSKSRKKNIAFPRQVAMYLSRKYTETPLVDIGRAFNRDHSTVVHSIKVITEKRIVNTSIRSQVELLESKLEKKYL